MFALDQNTLVFVAAGVTLLVAVLFVYLESLSKQIKGPKFWSAGSLLISLGLYLFAYHSYFGKYLTFVIGGTGIVLGISFYHAGLRKLKNKAITKWITIGLPLVHLIQGSIFTLIMPAEELRMILYSIINICISIVMIIEFRKADSKSLRRISNLGVLVFIVYGLTMIIRMVSTYILSPENAADETIINKILFYITILSQILMAFVFIIIFNIRLSDELKEQVKNRDRFFSIISHDLNGPVGTIAEMLQIINHTELFNKDRQKLLLSELEKLSSSTYQLLQNLLTWSRNQTNNIKVTKKTFDLGQLINQNVSLLEQAAKSKSIELKYINNSKIICFADPMMVDTILRNLISNAIKFTPQKGTVELTCGEINSFALITIKDNGMGISRDKLDKFNKNEQLLSSYGTGGEKGAGLGLSLCKDFVEKNKGNMEVKSTENSGTKISIKLPLDLNI